MNVKRCQKDDKKKGQRMRKGVPETGCMKEREKWKLWVFVEGADHGGRPQIRSTKHSWKTTAMARTKVAFNAILNVIVSPCSC